MAFSEVPAPLGLADGPRGWRGEVSPRVCAATVDDPDGSASTCVRAGRDHAPRRVSPARPDHATRRLGGHLSDPPPLSDRPQAATAAHVSRSRGGTAARDPRGEKRAEAPARAPRAGARPARRERSSRTSLPGRRRLERAPARPPRFFTFPPCRAACPGRRLRVPEPQAGAPRKLRARPLDVHQTRGNKESARYLILSFSAL